MGEVGVQAAPEATAAIEVHIAQAARVVARLPTRVEEKEGTMTARQAHTPLISQLSTTITAIISPM